VLNGKVRVMLTMDCGYATRVTVECAIEGWSSCGRVWEKWLTSCAAPNLEVKRRAFSKFKLPSKADRLS